MDHKKREKKIAEDIQYAIARLNHLNSLMGDVKKEVKKCQEKIDTATQQLKEIHNEHG